MNTTSTLNLARTTAIVAAFGWSAVAMAQTTPAPANPPASQPASSTIDDLLGITQEQPGAANASNAAGNDHQDQLKKELNEEQVADAFTQAIDKMSISARLLDTQFDPGVGTQRVQEDIIAKLNQLIDQAKKSKSKSKSSSSCNNPSQHSQQNPKTNPTPQSSKAAQKSQNDAAKRNDKPKDSQEGDPPALQQGDVNTLIDETRSEWGSLPQRVRDMLLQGRRDKFSSLYQQMTQEYYKRLAEEGTP
jgi:hypothetical protein